LIAREEEKRQGTSVIELKQQYEAAQTQYERRTVAFRAIDAGTIQRGQPVSTIDAVFGTHFASDLPVENSTTFNFIYFGPKMGGGLTPNGQTVAFGYFGWSMKVVYDHKGTVQSYELNNIWKDRSTYDASQQPIPITELKQLYESARTEDERRAVCLRAIDEGVIATLKEVATIDGVFGTHFAQDLPSRKERTRKVGINFASPNSAPESLGWRLVVEYFHDGSISNYYLTNVPQ
jgi:hypothetical protein